uniref:COX assembly mitochondrial protein n=1 Tax=Oreochromis aureus TaxID=47969 RepID=A0AAZ1XJW7_OREAU
MEATNAEETHLRHVEKDVLIPKKMREKAKELCADKVEAFSHCCKESGFFMVFKCREENAALKECLTRQSTFCVPPATRTPRFSKSASRSTFERSWNLRGRGFQPRTRNKNFRLACKKTTQQALFLKCTQTCTLPRTAGYVAVLWTSGCISCKATCLCMGKR